MRQDSKYAYCFAQVIFMAFFEYTDFNGKKQFERKIIPIK